jgi:MFS family permease
MTAPDTITTSAPPRRPAGWPLTATLIATSLGFAVIQLDVTVVNVAVKQIGASFGGGITGLQWVVGAYTLVLAALILTAGALGDRFGAGASAALSGGPVVGGFLIAAFGWRAIFFINVPLGAAGFWLALRYASETDRSARRRVDTRGAALATIAWPASPPR